jgi:hypothetical protein
MIRMIIIAGAVLLTLGGVAFAMSRPEVPDPGPPVLLDSSPTRAVTTPQAAPSRTHDADHDRDDAQEDRDATTDRDEDDFQVATPRAVEADEDDWDDDGIEVEDQDGDSDAEED